VTQRKKDTLKIDNIIWGNLISISICNCRGFNFRSFASDGEPFAPLPDIFDENKKFLEHFSRVSCRVGFISLFALFILECVCVNVYFVN
jgi:hypothetical protein